MRRKVPQIRGCPHERGRTGPLSRAMPAVPVQMSVVGLMMVMADVFVVAVVMGGIADRLEVAWNVRGEGFAADMLQIVRGVARRMLFVMPVMSVAPVDQRSRHLHDAAEVNHD